MRAGATAVMASPAITAAGAAVVIMAAVAVMKAVAGAMAAAAVTATAGISSVCLKQRLGVLQDRAANLLRELGFDAASAKAEAVAVAGVQQPIAAGCIIAVGRRRGG